MSLRVAERTELDRFRAFCLELRIEDGSPLVLYQEEEWIVADYFDSVREILVIIPKKNGKTTLIAALALYHLLVTPNAECIIVATSRDQAKYVLDQARMFVRQSEALERLVMVKQREIVMRDDEGTIRVLAADEDTADGAIPTLVIVDELHRAKSFNLYTVLRQGLDGRDGQLVAISTAGTAVDSPLGQMRQAAHQMPGFVRENKYSRVRSNRDFSFHEWCLDVEDDVEDMAVVKLVNPRPQMTIERLQQRRNSPSMTPWDWRRFACGIWTEGEEPWIEPEVWDGLRVDLGGVQEGSLVRLGVRIGQGGGIGVGIVAGDMDRMAVACEIHPFDFPLLERTLESLCERYQVQAIYADMRQLGIGFDALRMKGLPLEDLPQSPIRLMQATATFLQLVSEGTLVHDGDPVLRAQVMAGATRVGVGGTYVIPSDATQGLIAIMVAIHEAIKHAADRSPKIHSYRGA